VLAAEGGDMEYARGLLVDLEARYEAAAAMTTRYTEMSATGTERRNETGK